jgi:hypothetical protein
MQQHLRGHLEVGSKVVIINKDETRRSHRRT